MRDSWIHNCGQYCNIFTNSAKNALIGLSHTLAIEGNKYGIHSNVVIPTASSRLTAPLLLEESLRALKAEYVVPLVVYLGHESCQETGKVFEAGAGWFGQSKFLLFSKIYAFQNFDCICEFRIL